MQIKTFARLFCWVPLIGLGACASGSGDGTGGASGGGGITSGLPAVINQSSAKVVGRLGGDLRIDINGSDVDQDVLSAQIRLLDASGQEIALFDSDGNGLPDSGKTAAAFDSSVDGMATFDGVITMRGIAERSADIASVGVTLLDGGGRQSAETVVSVQTQAELTLGAACDINYVDNRCQATHGCVGTPTACAPGVAASIEQLAYVTNSGIVRILAEGLDVDDNLDFVELTFQDDQGQTITVDMDNDGSPDSSFFNVSYSGERIGGSFFVQLQPSESFLSQVHAVSAVAVDLGGLRSPAVVAAQTPVPLRGIGQYCDPRGFNACSTQAVCDPGIVGENNTCQPKSSKRTYACATAPLLEPGTGAVALSGVAEGASLWEPPAGCVNQDLAGRPEGIAKLRLASDAASVTFSTDFPGTVFDTVLYVLEGCPQDATANLGCIDDAGQTNPTASVVSLENLTAGDYLIVVDSWDPSGGPFRLQVNVE